ncbi:type VII secretion protein EccB [Mycobacterium asiaticum]|uniref:Type VII secretion protein EccB n=1 Tax=Mycobacterium asiaticum TaxID=1790 RepID=A0A1A3P7G4_MYCAS|nr:type VII secretion protein EccB [Mycobacterium asiaticum]OBK28527.1 type VII secretion protein EccB [Mycobacterium asiaticum]
MTLPATTWLHISGHRYLMRRFERALLGGELRSCAGPRRGALAIGGALTLIALLGCAFIGLLRPQAGLGDARIVMGQETGALYVRVGDTWHPVLNLASARLIAATEANPRQVRESELVHTKHGALLGIPGAPQLLGAPLPVHEVVWTICDSDKTTVLIGPVADLSLRAVGGDRTLLVAPDSGSPTYLLYNGQRALVDLSDMAVVRALRLSGQTPRIVSQALLNAVPEAPPITVPRIRGAGSPAGTWLPGFTVGNVLRITRATDDEYYVVLGTGVQRIGTVAADLLGFGGKPGAATVISVAPDVLRSVPVVDALAMAGLPERLQVDVADGTLCVTWTPGRSGKPEIALLTGDGPTSATALAQGDGRGPAVDAFGIEMGRSAYVAARNLTGEQGRTSTRYLITDSGVRFAIRDDDAAHDLGLSSTPAPAPWPLLAALPNGPELSREKASVARDTLGP